MPRRLVDPSLTTCTEFAGASPPVAASSLGHVAGPHLPRCVLATNDDPPATSAQNLRTNPLSALHVVERARDVRRVHTDDEQRDQAEVDGRDERAVQRPHLV